MSQNQQNGSHIIKVTVCWLKAGFHSGDAFGKKKKKDGVE